MLVEKLFATVEKKDAKLAKTLKTIWEYSKVPGSDVSFPCFKLSGDAKQNAQEISDKLSLHAKGIASISLTGAYVNLIFESAFIAKNLKKPKKWKRNKKRMVIDYSSPNIAKPFGIGHLRSTVIGASIKNCYDYTGWATIGINHIGDWGTQFGILIAAFKRWGDEKELKKDSVRHLYELYVKFNAEMPQNPSLENEGREWFKKLEENDKEARHLWKLFIDGSMKNFNTIYKLLGVSFEHTLGESFYEDKMPTIVKELKKNNLLKQDEGAWIVDFADHNIDLTPAIIIKTNGTTTYALRDVASLLYRKKEFKFDKALYEVGAEQTLHFKQVFAIAKLLGYDLDCEHITHGLYVLPEGKMSTRKGTIIFVDDIIEETTKRARIIIDEKNPDLKNKDEVSQKIALAALIFQDLRQDRVKSVTFSWEKMFDFEGESGPYLQYTYARISSIIRKAKTPVAKTITRLETLEEQQLALHLSKFDECVQDTAQQARPHILCRYLLDLAQLASGFYAKHRVIQDDKKLMHERLALLGLVNETLKSGLSLLLIPTVEQM